MIGGIHRGVVTSGDYYWDKQGGVYNDGFWGLAISNLRESCATQACLMVFGGAGASSLEAKVDR